MKKFKCNLHFIVLTLFFSHVTCIILFVFYNIKHINKNHADFFNWKYLTVGKNLTAKYEKLSFWKCKTVVFLLSMETHIREYCKTVTSLAPYCDAVQNCKGVNW
jgi:hypothetical protein